MDIELKDAVDLTIMKRFAIWLLRKVTNEDDRVWCCQGVVGDEWRLVRKDYFRRLQEYEINPLMKAE